jgi:hypothetical protein
MIKLQKIIFTCFLALSVLIGVSSAQAALVNYSITGEVSIGDEVFPNVFGLTGNSGLPGGDTITATGVFDNNVLINGTGTVVFGFNSGNSMTITVGTATFFASNDASFADGEFPSITLSEYIVTDFSFLAEWGTNGAPANFSSFGTSFDDGVSMVGSWQTTPIPVPAALWLFGAGLMGLVGVARRGHKA